MSTLGDAIGRKRRGQSAVPAAPEPAPASPRQAAPAAVAPDGRSELQRKRDDLAEQVTELHWDLGGLAYEMAIRDHFRLDVLVRRAAVLQERDAQLAEVERLLALEQSASVGSCPACGAPHSRGAVFCWQCGATLMERAPSTAVPALGMPGAGAGTGDERDATTVGMDALLTHGAGGGDSRGVHADGSYTAGSTSPTEG